VSHLARLSLRARLALALVGVALLAVALAAVIGNLGLDPRLNEAAHARLQPPRGLSLRRYRYAAMPQPRARTPLVRWPERPPPPATLTATAQMRATTGLNCSNTLAKERCRVPR
jgi:hypothetical protein